MLHRLLKTLRFVGATACACLLVACVSGGAQRVPAPVKEYPDAATKPHTVALLGASGMVGSYLLQEALARGYTVRALARNPAKLEEFSDRISIIQGDARDLEVVRELLRGSDVVISALGPVKSDGDGAQFISTTATGHILQAMAGAGTTRLLIVSGGAVVMPGDERNLLGWWIRTLVQVGLPDVLRDKQAEYDLLAGSEADWTLVRCPLIDAEPFLRDPVASLVTPPAFRVRAGELARFMIDQIDSPEFTRKGPFLGSD